MRIHLDFETYSEIDLLKLGSWVYTRHLSTEVLCMGYSIGDGDVEVLTGDDIPVALRDFSVMPGVRLHAFNAMFELLNCINVLDVKELGDPELWDCAMAAACAASWPHALGFITHKMPIPEEYKKDPAGEQLIKDLSMPQKRGKGANAELVHPRSFWSPDEYEEKLEAFCNYCAQDVVAERDGVYHRVRPLPEQERRVWINDQRINLRGMKCDVKYTAKAYRMFQEVQKRGFDHVRKITESSDNPIQNPNSPKQIHAYLQGEGVELPNLQAPTVTQAVKYWNMSDTTREVLQTLSDVKTTMPQKYLAMLARADRKDHRIHDMVFYHGASTGRSASKGVNLMNLPRPIFKDSQTAVDLIESGDPEMIRLLAGNPIDTICSGIRPALIPEEGYRFVDCDYSSIEARVLRWLANDEDTLQKVRDADDRGDSSFFYKVAAEGVFGVPAARVEKGTTEYQGGKAAELACGYQGGAAALASMAGTLNIDLSVPAEFSWATADPDALNYIAWWKEKIGPLNPLEEYHTYIVFMWRKANAACKEMWNDFEDCAISSIENPGMTFEVNDKIAFKSGDWKGIRHMWMQLPSGRLLSYPLPSIGQGNFGKPQIEFHGIDTKTRQWGVVSTYGGKLVENATQATARDIMVEGALRLQGTVYERIVLTVYDQVVSEVELGKGSAAEMSQIMCELPTWAEGLPLAADGEEIMRFWK